MLLGGYDQVIDENVIAVGKVILNSEDFNITNEHVPINTRLSIMRNVGEYH